MTISIVDSIIEITKALETIDATTHNQIIVYVQNIHPDKLVILKSIKNEETFLKDMVVCCYNDLKNIFKDGKIDYSDIVYFIDMIKVLFQTVKSKNLLLEKNTLFVLCEVVCQILILVLNRFNFEIDMFQKVLSSAIQLLAFDMSSTVENVTSFCCWKKEQSVYEKKD
jgi:hypothetical protein